MPEDRQRGTSTTRQASRDRPTVAATMVGIRKREVMTAEPGGPSMNPASSEESTRGRDGFSFSAQFSGQEPGARSSEGERRSHGQRQTS
jgi:hypothetical protein